MENLSLPTIVSGVTMSNYSTLMSSLRSKFGTLSNPGIDVSHLNLSIQDKFSKLQSFFSSQDVLMSNAYTSLLDLVSLQPSINLPRILEVSCGSWSRNLTINGMVNNDMLVEIDEELYTSIASIFTTLTEPITFTIGTRAYNIGNAIETTALFNGVRDFEIEGIMSTYIGSAYYDDQQNVAAKYPLVMHTEKNDVHRYYLAQYLFDSVEGFWFYHNDQPDISLYSIAEVLNKLKPTLSLNTMFSTICKRIRETGSFVYNDILTEIKSVLGELTVDIRDVLSDLSSAWNRYGISGVFNKLVSILKRLFSIGTDSDQAYATLHFDNTISVIADYSMIMRGAFSFIGEVAYTVLMFIGGTYGVIARAVATIGRSVIGAIREVINSQTGAEIDSLAQYCGYPNGIFNTVQDLSTLPSDLQNILLEEGCVKIAGLGGDLVMSIYESSSNVYKVKYALFINAAITKFPTNLYNYLFNRTDQQDYSFTLQRSNFNHIRICFDDDVSNDPLYDLQCYRNELSNADFDKQIRKIYIWNCLYALLSIIGSCTWNGTPSTNVFSSSSTSFIIHAVWQMYYYGIIGDAGANFAWTDIVDSNVTTNYDVRNLYVKSILLDDYTYYDNSVYLNEINFQGLLTRIYPEFITDLYGSNNITPLPDLNDFIIQIPKYDRKTIIGSILLGALITVAAVSVIAITGVKVKNRIRSWNAKAAANAEKAWQSYMENPTSTNYKTYKSAVIRNNWIAKLTGGTQYSTNGFWAESSSGSTSLIENGLTDSIIGQRQDENGNLENVITGSPTLKTITERLNSIEYTISQISLDTVVSTLQNITQNISDIKNDVSNLKTDVETLQSDVIDVHALIKPIE